MEIEETLKKDYKVPWWIVIGVLLLLVVALVISIDWKTMIGVVVSLFTSLLAAFLFNRMTKTYENEKLNVLRNITDQDFFLKLLQNIKRFNKVYVKDWNVCIKLSKIESERNYYKCTIAYKYKKKLLNRKIKMIFYRILEIGDEEKIPTHIDLANEYEFYWILDESKFENRLTANDFNIRELVIDTEKIEFEKTVQENIIIFETTLQNQNKVLDRDDLTYLSYEVDFLIEKEDIIKIDLDVPTKHIDITFDTNDLSDEIVTYAIETTSFTDKPLMFPKDHSWKFIYHDWLMPKNAFIFAWWKNAY